MFDFEEETYKTLHVLKNTSPKSLAEMVSLG
jgi:hypothetical protein